MKKETAKYDPILKRPRFNCSFPSCYHDSRIAKQIFVKIRDFDTKRVKKN